MEDQIEANLSKNSAASLSIAEQRQLLRSETTSAVESVTAFLDEVEKKRDLNVSITVNRDGAREQAREADRRINEGTPRALEWALEGIPIAVKDNYCTKDIRTTAGSRMLEQFVPTYESAVTQRLIDAGAVILDKTNMDEFAMGSSTETSYFGPTINPVGVQQGYANLVPGGPLADQPRRLRLGWLWGRLEATLAAPSGSQPAFAASSG